MSISSITILALTGSIVVLKLAVMALVVVLATKTLLAAGKPLLLSPKANKLSFINKRQTHV